MGHPFRFPNESPLKSGYSDLAGLHLLDYLPNRQTVHENNRPVGFLIGSRVMHDIISARARQIRFDGFRGDSFPAIDEAATPKFRLSYRLDSNCD